MEQSVELNQHNKQEFEPAHTAEHILNQTMIRMFDCGRSFNAHIERKKSKCDYHLSEAPTDAQIKEVERRVCEVIAANMPVTTRMVTRGEAAGIVDLSKLPTEAGEHLRLVYVGDYDVCACIGAHVNNTSEIETFKIISFDYSEGVLRIRFKVLA